MTRSPTGWNTEDAVSPEEAFALLGNDTRVGILQALWDAFESSKGDNDVSYSELFERTPVGESTARTVGESLAGGRDGSAFDPGRDAEERLLDALAG